MNPRRASHDHDHTAVTRASETFLGSSHSNKITFILLKLETKRVESESAEDELVVSGNAKHGFSFSVCRLQVPRVLQVCVIRGNGPSPGLVFNQAQSHI